MTRKEEERERHDRAGYTCCKNRSRADEDYKDKDEDEDDDDGDDG